MTIGSLLFNWHALLFAVASTILIVAVWHGVDRLTALYLQRQHRRRVTDLDEADWHGLIDDVRAQQLHALVKGTDRGMR